MGIPVKLEAFEGPLDLLLHLIDKNKVNIYDIPIVEITAQYMEYIHEMQRQDLNVMSEFLLMAATLLDIKSRMLLPKGRCSKEFCYKKIDGYSGQGLKFAIIRLAVAFAGKGYRSRSDLHICRDHFRFPVFPVPEKEAGSISA